MPSKQRQTGMTLIEIMIVIVIAAILAAMAAPSFNDFIVNTRLTSTMSELAGDLNRARSEAIKRNTWVLVCVVNAAGNDCGTGTDWKAGWWVCSTSTVVGSTCDASTAANANPMTKRPPVNASYSLTGNAAFIRFYPNGTGTAGTIALAYGTKSRTAHVVSTGNISVSNP